MYIYIIFNALIYICTYTHTHTHTPLRGLRSLPGVAPCEAASPLTLLMCARSCVWPFSRARALSHTHTHTHSYLSL